MPSGLFRKLLRRIVILIAFGYGLCLVDRSNMGLAQLQMTEDLGMSQALFGAASSIFFATYTTLQMPANHFLTKIGPRRALATYAISWGVLSAAHGFATSTTQIMILRLLLGVAESGYYPGCVFVLSQWFPMQLMGQANAIFGVLSGILTAPISSSGGWIMDVLDGACGLRGWRWLFLLQGLPSVPLGIILLWVFDDSPADASFLDPAEQKHILEHAATVHPLQAKTTGGAHRDGSSPSPLGLTAAIRRLIVLPGTWIFGTTWFAFSVTMYTMSFFIPRITKDIMADWSLTVISLFQLVPGTIGLVGSILIARWSDEGGAGRKAVVIWGMPVVRELGTVALEVPLALAAAQGSAGVAEGKFLFVMAQLVLVWLVQSPGVFWAQHVKNTPSDILPISIAFINTFGQVGGLVGPLVFGLIHDGLPPTCANLSSSCPAQWGVPLLALNGTTSVLMSTMAVLAFRVGYMRDGPRGAPLLV